jgi:pimeloyl-ACP methyl ester carboxylesterase
MKNESIRLTDGRALGFQRLGDPSGKALFFFHGTPGSRLVFSENDRMAQIAGIDLITPDRPGYGISDPKPDRVLPDWARDVAELADYLGIESFAVAGESGGGPHALEVGAGGGSIAEWLCSVVGPDGPVIATDLETKFLSAIESPNLEVREHNVVTDPRRVKDSISSTLELFWPISLNATQWSRSSSWRAPAISRSARPQ